MLRLAPQDREAELQALRLQNEEILAQAAKKDAVQALSFFGGGGDSADSGGFTKYGQAVDLVIPRYPSFTCQYHQVQGLGKV